MMKKFIKNDTIRFYLWVSLAFFIIHSFTAFLEYRDTFPSRLVNSFLLVSYIAVPNFLLIEVALPQFGRKWKQIATGILYIILLLPFLTVGLVAWRYLWVQLGVYTDFIPGTSFINSVAVHSSFSLATVIFFAIARNIYSNIKLKQAAQQLLTEKKEAELNYLKAQTNPHFLFNTLNNIYSLARDKSDLTPESILRLSKILRFMLYETGGSFIAIEDELKIMGDYIALEKLRYDESLLVNFDTEVEDMKQPLPPLLLIPLIENAFKHGVSETRNQPFVDIHLRVKKLQLTFVVKNSVDVTEGALPIKENIGLSNLRRQLQLLYKEYELVAAQNESVFTATLKINLASHV